MSEEDKKSFLEDIKIILDAEIKALKTKIKNLEKELVKLHESNEAIRETSFQKLIKRTISYKSAALERHKSKLETF